MYWLTGWITSHVKYYKSLGNIDSGLCWSLLVFAGPLAVIMKHPTLTNSCLNYLIKWNLYKCITNLATWTIHFHWPQVTPMNAPITVSVCPQIKLACVYFIQSTPCIKPCKLERTWMPHYTLHASANTYNSNQ